MSEKEQISPTVSLLLKICAVVGALALVYYLRNVLLPFAVAFMLAYILNPVVHFFQRFLRRRWIAVVVTLLLTFTLFSVILAVILPLLFAEMRHLYTLLVEHNILNEWQDGLPSFITDYINKLSNNEKLAAILASDNIAAMIDSLAKALLPHLGSFFSKTYSAIASALGAAIIILYLIFIMLDYEGISKGIVELVPTKFKERFLRFFTRFTSEMQKYFRGQIIIVLCVMVLYSFGFMIIGLPLGLLLGLMRTQHRALSPNPRLPARAASELRYEYGDRHTDMALHIDDGKCLCVGADNPRYVSDAKDNGTRHWPQSRNDIALALGVGQVAWISRPDSSNTVHLHRQDLLFGI